MEYLLISLLIDLYENRDIAIFGVPGAYLQVDLATREIDERVLLKLAGDFADLMCEVNPEHTKNIVYEKGRKFLYMSVLKAIYGCIESVLRWYKLYSSMLHGEGFVINPYDPCVANKLIKGK